MIINIKNKEIELRYSFNSFKYMGELNMSELQEVESKPFKIIPMVEILLLGATNNDPKVKVSLMDVQAFLEKYMEDEEEQSISDLLEELMTQLQNSSFFKSLQKNNKKK